MYYILARMVLNMRGTLRYDQPWDVQVLVLAAAHALIAQVIKWIRCFVDLAVRSRTAQCAATAIMFLQQRLAANSFIVFLQVDLFFHRDPEELEDEAAEEARAEYLAQCCVVRVCTQFPMHCGTSVCSRWCGNDRKARFMTCRSCLHAAVCMQEYAGEAYGEDAGYGQPAIDYGATPAVMDADYSMPAEGATGFEPVAGPGGMEYAVPATDFAAGY